MLLDLGGVFVDDTRAKQAGRPVAEGQKVVAHLGGALARATNQTGLEARARDEADLPSYAVIHEDDELLVVDKPAGLLTAPTPESDRNNLAGLLSRRGERRQSIFVVHRIDLETSGLLVFAKTPDANRVLGEMFRRHDLTRAYLAVALGKAATGTIDRPIDGRRAVTHVVEAEPLAATTFLRLRLETGRTHQIRIHLRALGNPVLGDRQHGTPTAFDPPRMALHATQLAFRHPLSGAALDFSSPWPADLAPWLEGLGKGADKGAE